MLDRSLALALAIACAVATHPAYAFWDPPYVTPPNPVAGQAVSVGIRAGICDAIVEMDGYPRISRSGNALRILFYGVQIRNPDFCNLPIGTLVTPVASLEAGNYTLAVDVLYDNYPFGYDTLHLGVVPFAVGGSPRPAEPVPSMDGATGLLLGVLLAFVARRALSGSAKRGRMLV